jgi:hypothetical protein
MVAVEQPRADCGHVAAVTQHCGRCLRWCCPECYAPWTALACGGCRAEARAAAVAAVDAIRAIEVTIEPSNDARCPGRSRGRRSAGPHRHREPSDVRALAARVADLERRLQELRPGF